MDRYDFLQLREVFHLEFLRRFGRLVKAEKYAVKGGVNLRFFFKSFRYSEDMDIDARGMGVAQLRDAVMKILQDRTFQDNLKPFGIAGIMPPDMSRAKQTETTQRFKVHIIASSGEDLFTKIEFSRRPFAGDAVVETVDGNVLRAYKLAPLLAPHYDCRSAVEQKLGALALRPSAQARDIFDLYVLSTQYDARKNGAFRIEPDCLSKAHERLFDVEFERFRDTVISYLSADDQAAYDKPASWEDVRLKVADFIERVRMIR